jgi:hypothetical protein
VWPALPAGYRTFPDGENTFEPSHYTFDFVRSSFLSTETEQEIRQLYADPTHTSSYMLAMTALAEYLLERSIRRCRTNGERLLIYEDGAYTLPVVYQIYHEQSHRLHQLLKAAVDDRVLVGGVEVTTSGERKQAAVIQANQGKALVPVLSCARDDIKMIYESIGVAEAVIQSAATALGNLGLPTFETRRIAIVGGNGAIGTRLIEKLTQAHNATAHIFAVDLVGTPFTRQIPGDAFPYLASKLQYQPLPRYVVEERCLPMVLPHMFDVPSALSVPESVPTCRPTPVAAEQRNRGVFQSSDMPSVCAITSGVHRRLNFIVRAHSTGLSWRQRCFGVLHCCGGVTRYTAVPLWSQKREMHVCV